MKRTTLTICSFLLPIALSGAARADDSPDRMFKSKCASCHGADGKGKTKQGEKMKIGDMTSAAFKKDFPAAKIETVIADGVTREKDGVKQEMKPMKDKLTPDQIKAIAAYVAALK